MANEGGMQGGWQRGGPRPGACSLARREFIVPAGGRQAGRHRLRFASLRLLRPAARKHEASAKAPTWASEARAPRLFQLCVARAAPWLAYLRSLPPTPPPPPASPPHASIPPRFAMAVVGKCAVHLRLIEAVREHEVLYNCDLKDYSDNILKMRLWRLIARKCDIASGDEAKKIWKNLRDGYRCSLKTLKIYEKKEPPRPLKPWKYVEEMDFLRPFMKDRIFTNVAYYEGYSVDFVEKRTRVSGEDNTMDSDMHVPSSISSFSGGDSTDLQEEIECRPDVTLLAQQELLNQLQHYELKDERDSAAQITNDLTSQAMSQLEALANIYQHPPGLHISMGSSPKKRGRKRRGKVDLDPPFPMVQLPSSMERHQNIDNGDTSEDSLKLFFDSMYATAKSLPTPLQRLIRIKLFQTVTDAEMAAESMAMEMLPHGAVVYGNHLQIKQDSPSE